MAADTHLFALAHDLIDEQGGAVHFVHAWQRAEVLSRAMRAAETDERVNTLLEPSAGELACAIENEKACDGDYDPDVVRDELCEAAINRFERALRKAAGLS